MTATVLPDESSMRTELPPGQPTLRVVPMPSDVNSSGDIFGGWVMSQVDIAGGIAASRVARCRLATVAVNAFQFKQPISVGDTVSFYAKVARIGNTSVTVDVQVFAERNPFDPVVVKVTEATLTYVAIAPDGRKQPLRMGDLNT